MPLAKMTFTAGGTGWHGAAAIVHLLLLISFLSIAEANRLFSEGGSFSSQDDALQAQDSITDDSNVGQFTMESDYQQEPDQLFIGTGLSPREGDRQRQRLASIVKQLRRRNKQEGLYSQQELADGPGVFVETNEPVLKHSDIPDQSNPDLELAELNQLGAALQQISSKFDEEGENPEVQQLVTTVGNNKNLEAVKKGQNEFVEFVEPLQNKRLKNMETIDKRVPDYVESEGQGQRRRDKSMFKLFNSGNVLFIAYLTICCVGVVAGTVGGVYYYKNVRITRMDDPFNEFTRYSPSGPGKDKLKKGGIGGTMSPTVGQTGDDTLAYKAQLHHYQQQKQKILGGNQGPPVAADTLSDNEEDTDELEHNFSVFECPGLAPTGDVEIQNPNFVGESIGEKKTSVSQKMQPHVE